MVDIYYNKRAFIEKKPKKLFFLIFFFFALFLLFLGVASHTESYDHYITRGYVDCRDDCFIVTVIPSHILYQKVLINNKNWNFDLVEKELQIDEENMISYYRLIFPNDGFAPNEFVNFNFYYNKQSLLKKWIKKIF